MTKTASSKQIAFETYERQETIQGSSERSFGLVFAAFFVVVATLKHWPNLTEAYPWLFAAAAMLIAALLCPKVLKPFNKLWMQFGLLLHRIMNPIIMGQLFFFVLTPMGLIARACGWDPLRLKWKKNLNEKTYWIIRESSQVTDLKNQF